jgi:hypothetical protein
VPTACAASTARRSRRTCGSIWSRPQRTASARRLADEAAVDREPSALGPLVGTALVGAVLGAVLGFAAFRLVYSVGADPLESMAGSRIPVQVVLVVYYGLPAAAVVAGAVAAVRYRLRSLPRIRATAHAMMVLMPIAGLLATPATMAFAWTTGYSTSTQVLAAEVLIVVAALAGAVVLARRWALRERRDRAPAAISP